VLPTTTTTRTPDKPSARVHVALTVVQLLFVGNAVVGRIALRSVTPATLLAVRAPSAAIIFLLLRVVLSRSAGWERVSRGDLLKLAACALLGVTLNQLLFFEGLARSTATNAVVIGATIPVLTAGIAIAVGTERATLRRVLGLCCALAGALGVVLFGRPHGQLGFGTGELLLLGNSTAYALYLVVSRPLFHRYRTDTAITWIFAFGALMLLPLGIRPLLHELPVAPLSAYASLAYIVLGPTVAAYFLNGFALRRAPSSLVAVYIYMQPVVGAVVAARWLDEKLTVATALGALCIGGGIALVATERRATPSPRA
jgi:drug/metabolite transporter (DMT)-like permease